MAKMTDEAIVSYLGDYLSQPSGLNSSTLSRERKEVQEYYDGNSPKASRKGRSGYVSLDVWDSVESLKANLIEAFVGPARRVRFAPENPDDTKQAEIATEVCDYVIHRQNDGEELYQDILHNGLTNRGGIGKVWWDETKDEIEEEFEDYTEDELIELLSADDVEVETDDSITGDPDTGLFSGTILRVNDKSKVCVKAIAPEDFVVSHKAADLESARVKGDRTITTRSDLKAQGFDADLVDKIKQEDKDDDPEVLARFEQIEDLETFKDFQDATEEVAVFELYAKMDVDGSGRAKLWKVIIGGDTLLHKEQVLKHPYISYTALRRPHSFWGTNFAYKAKATQDAKTVLTRGILDHTVWTNNPRWQVVNGTLRNPNELMDNRFGGVVNTKRADGIRALEQPPLNPYVFQTIGLLDERKEDATGVSKLSKGLNQDALSNQNSGAMIQDLTTLSMQRQKLMARNFARFVRDLYLKVYELVLENNQDRSLSMEIAGDWVEVTPSQWRERKDIIVDVALGWGEDEAEAQKLLSMHQMQLQSGNPLYGAQQQYEALRDIYKRMGVRDANRYLMKPEEMPKPQPDPMAIKEMEFKEREMALKEREQALKEAEFQHKSQKDTVQFQADQEKMAVKHSETVAKQRLSEREQAHKEETDEAELEIMQDQKTEVRGIASP